MTNIELLDVTHVSRKASSLRISIPKKVAERLGLEPENVLGFYLSDGKIVIEKIK